MPLVVLVAVAYVVVQLVRPTPAEVVHPVAVSGAFTGPRPALGWPDQGQAAVGVEGVGLLATHGGSQPVPIASVAKIMTAYLVLHDHPLPNGAQGPAITITPTDALIYALDRADGQSVVAVQPGEQLTERQALEALLIPSGNNIATLLASWDAGSQAAFVAKMNAEASALGLDQTHYADASGVQPATTSTAADQVLLSMRALEVRAFRQIVAMPQAVLPVAGLQYNVNALLDKNGVVGVKTGSTSQAGGCIVFAAVQAVAGTAATVVGAVLGQQATAAQPSIIDASLQAASTLLASVPRSLRRVEAVRPGTPLAQVIAPWTRAVKARASGPVFLLGWPGLAVRVRVVPFPRLTASIPKVGGSRPLR